MDFVLQNALRQQRFVREVTIQYNLCNEPWYASISWRFTVQYNRFMFYVGQHLSNPSMWYFCNIYLIFKHYVGAWFGKTFPVWVFVSTHYQNATVFLLVVSCTKKDLKMGYKKTPR